MKLTPIICKFFLFSLILLVSNQAFAIDYINNNLSGTIYSNSAFDNITITNQASSNLSNNSDLGFIEFDNQHANTTITNNGSISSTGDSHLGIYFLDYGNTVTSSNSIFTVNNNGTLQTNGDLSPAIYLPTLSDGLYYDLNINNSGTISAAGTYSSTIEILRQTNNGTSTITNSGIISKTFVEDSATIFIDDGNSVITNSGTISAGDSSKLAISLGGNNATLNILEGSNIVGKISSDATTSTLNIKESISSSDYNSLLSQLIGSSWTTNISSSSGSYTNGISESLLTMNLTDSGSLTNNGEITTVNSSGANVYNNSDSYITDLNVSGIGIATTSGPQVNNLSANVSNSGYIENLNLAGSNNLVRNSRFIENLNSSGTNNVVVVNNAIAFDSIHPNGVSDGINNITNSGSLIFSIGAIIAPGSIIAPQIPGPINPIGAIDNSGTVTMLVDSGSYTYNRVISGNGDFVKSGAGTVILSNTNLYTGATTISAGELKVNGSIASSSSTTIASGGILSGTGTIGNLTLNSGASFAPGNSIGTTNVSGNFTMNSGSTLDIEYNNNSMDKVVASGNITLAGTANFSIYNYNPDNIYVVSQDILETTGGTLSGKFDNMTTDDNKFIASTSYTSTTARATVSRKLNSSTLDAPLFVQNSIGRMFGKSIFEELNNHHDSGSGKTSSWISGSAFNSNSGALDNSSPFSTSGYLTSAGLVKNYEDFQIIGGLFNSQANANRFNYFGKDQIETNGFALGLGKNYPITYGSFYNSIQVGAGFYNSNNSRNVVVNDSYQSARSRGKGNFKYINFGTAYNIPTKDFGQFAISLSASLQDTSNNGFSESGLSYGNFSASKSSARTANLELGTSYKNNFAKFVGLPDKSFFKIEATAYQSNLSSKKSATISQGNASYALDSQYKQGMVFGANALVSIPVNDSTSIVAKIERRQSGSLRNNIGTFEIRYQF